MQKIEIKTQRLRITHFDESMVHSVQQNSLDADNRTFVPDEVFETFEEAQETVEYLMCCYKGDAGPFVYPVLLHGGVSIGYVQAVPLDSGDWEIGYHIAKKHTRCGYATEAVTAFLPVIMELLGITQIWGICRSDNAASRRVLEKAAFLLQETVTMDYKGQRQEICKYLYRMASSEGL
jgi:RimJ/RimL family protein N-acetyltransferase